MTPLDIYDKCIEVGDCLEWQGRFGTSGHPRVCVSRTEKDELVRRVLVELVTDRPIAPHLKAAMRCRNPRCVKFEHITQLTAKQVVQLAAREGRLSSPQRSAAVAKYARAHRAKLSLEKVAHIRASDETCKALAEKYGVNKSMVARIRRGQAWRVGAPNSSVFAMAV